MNPSKNSAFAVVVCLVALVHFPLGVRATSTGALERSCASMIPEHGVAAQSVPSPYAIRVSTTAAKAGDTLKVMIAGLTAADTFKGFLLQARVADGRNGTEAVGEFVVDAAVKSVKTLKCGASPKSAVTHATVALSPQTLTFTWVAPSALSGPVQFVATVAREWNVFWVGVKSETITIVA